MTEQTQITLIEDEPRAVQVALPESSPMGMMLAAMRQGANLEQVEKMMGLQRQWEADEARKAYNAAFAAFKSEAVKVIKNKQVTNGPLTGKNYAELHTVVNAVTPALSAHGLSASWKITRDEREWIEVTCTIKHAAGHSESVSMGGPPDAGGAKNPIQARASTVSYLERYTLKAIVGIAEQDDDTDGGWGDSLVEEWVSKLAHAASLQEVSKIRKEAGRAFTVAKNVPGYATFAKAATEREVELKKDQQ